jgi:stalled ribosome alternative rescue factor ArfA
MLLKYDTDNSGSLDFEEWFLLLNTLATVRGAEGKKRRGSYARKERQEKRKHWAAYKKQVKLEKAAKQAADVAEATSA